MYIHIYIKKTNQPNQTNKKKPTQTYTELMYETENQNFETKTKNIA